MKVLLIGQHRSEDDKYARFLDHIRVWQPSQKLLNKIQKEKILFDYDPNDEEIFQALTYFPESTLITVSCHAAIRINTVYITRILDKSSLLGHVTSDCELGHIPVYKGMRVIFTQNQNKALCIVNGRIATVVQLERNILFLKLRNGRIIHIHPVSF